MATLDTAALDDGSPAAGAHAGTKAVLALTAAYVGLVCAFHSKGSPGRGDRGRR